MPTLHGRGLHADVLVGLQRQYPGHSVATLERAVNYNGGSVEASRRMISAVEVGDEDRCRPSPRSLLPADGWKTDFVPDPFVLPPDADQIQSLPSRQYQLGTEKNYFDELQHCLDKAVLAAQNRKNAAKMGARPPRPRSAMIERPWQRRPAKNDVPPPEWHDTRSPCVLCRRKSTHVQPVLTTVAEGLCAACHAYYVSLGAGDRPDLSWLRWEHDGVIPEPEPEVVSPSSERRRSSGMTQHGTRATKPGFKPGLVAGAAARRHQAAIQEARRLREESSTSPSGRNPAVGGRSGRPRSATSFSSSKEQAAQTKSEVARFRAKAARQKREKQESDEAVKARRAAIGRRLAAATVPRNVGRGTAAEKSSSTVKGTTPGSPRLAAKGKSLEVRRSGRQAPKTAMPREPADTHTARRSSSTVSSPPLSPSASSAELDSNSSSEKINNSDLAEAEEQMRAAEEAAAAAHVVITNPEAWESFRAIVCYHEGSPSAAKPASRHAAVSFEAIRGYLTSLGEVEFAASRAAVDCFAPGASPTRGTPRGSHIEAALAAVEQSGGVTFKLFLSGYQSWQNARGVHRNRAARLVQDMEDRSAVRSKEKLVKRIDLLVRKMARDDSRADGRVCVEGGLQRIVGAISQAAFTDGLASAQGSPPPGVASSSDTSMDPAMLSEVKRTSKKIGGDIGDGVSVTHAALADMLLDVFEGDFKTLTSVENILR
eukprot:COSAG02_NODE_1357_length_13081_cov_2.571792_2_plen_712_part_00